MEGLLDGTVFFLGRTCVEDFKEILLLCSNGFGFGAAKILRGMFERVVTIKYLRQNSEACQDFMDFNDLNRLKFFDAVVKVHGAEIVPPEEVDALRERAPDLRQKFAISCPNCGAQRPNYTWSKLDMVSMARSVGMDDLLPNCYYMPLFYAHGTAQSFISRLVAREEGVGFQAGPDTKQADGVLCYAHRLLLEVILLQRNHFQIETCDELLTKCDSDLAEIWGLQRAE